MIRKKGFTLIEMLGIITVLGIILLVTFPVMTTSLKKIKETTTNNIKSRIKIGAEAYAGLHDFEDQIEITVQDLYDAQLIKGSQQGISPSQKIEIIKNIDGTVDVYLDMSSIQYTYSTAGESTLTIPTAGIYKLEVWGAQGGNAYESGYGGYSVGMINLNLNDKLYINVGGKGTVASTSSIAGGYNGGGNGAYVDGSATSASGGGASHIALKSGTLASFDTNNDGVGSESEIEDILIVAGGGGGSGNWDGGLLGGTGGGYIGGNGVDANSASYTNRYAIGATQSGGGYANNNSSVGVGQFGKGGSSSTGGGGGFYGGGASSHKNSGGGGGSGYIGNTNLFNQIMYCYNCAESNDANTKTVSTTGSGGLVDTTNCPNGYSETPVSKCAKKDNGYVKITFVGQKL